jgi:SAM-dependent methyltransferase
LSSFELYQQQRITHWNKAAANLEKYQTFNRTYKRRLAEIYRFLIPPDASVLEIGCAQGDLLASLGASRSVGVDFSEEMIQRGRHKHPDLSFLHTDAHDFSIDEKFDTIIFSDVLNDLWDVQKVFETIHSLAKPHSRLIINTYSRLWETSFWITEKLGLSTPKLQQNWLVPKDITNLLNLCGFETIRSWQEVLLPLPIPLLNPLCNKTLVKIPPFNMLALTNFILARPLPEERPDHDNLHVSVIVPARNEAGNINNIFERVPKMGEQTELVFVEGHSSDNTAEEIEKQIGLHPEWACQFLQQSGSGKGNAVREGFARANGDILMILDADMTVPPEDLPRFYDALARNKGEFINGVRLVYPMEKAAMRFFNFLGNKFFSIAFSWLLGQPVKDTLCGTKVLWKEDYERIAANRSYFGEFDPFGDFDLIFGAAKLGLKIVDLPIRYRERIYGTTNIQRWKHGWLLLRMVLYAAARLKFI